MDTTETAQRIAASIAALPPLPSTAQRILACFGDEFIDADAVTAVVENDPAICARLLGLSNSSYFGLAQPVTNIREAISRVLGVDTVRSLVLAMAIQRSFNTRRCPGFDAEHFWKSSLQTAECCKKLASGDAASDVAVRDLAYSTGLCHNLGLMALAHMEPERTNRVLQACESQESASTLRQLFEKELRTDHRIVTAELARCWSLPDLMVSAYQYRAFPDLPAEGRLGPIIAVGAAVIGNMYADDGQKTDLQRAGGLIGLDADELQEMAMLSERQQDSIQSISCSMA